MKKTDLEKLKGKTIASRMQQSAGSFGKGPAAGQERREQRKLDQAAGLVPFAVKLDMDLVKQIQTLAQARNSGLNAVVAELLKMGLGG